MLTFVFVFIHRNQKLSSRRTTHTRAFTSFSSNLVRCMLTITNSQIQRFIRFTTTNQRALNNTAATQLRKKSNLKIAKIQVIWHFVLFSCIFYAKCFFFVREPVLLLVVFALTYIFFRIFSRLFGDSVLCRGTQILRQFTDTCTKSYFFWSHFFMDNKFFAFLIISCICVGMV